MDIDDYESNEEHLISKFETYHDFLNYYIKDEDRKYLEDESLARDVKELYEINKGDIKNEEHFNKRKREIELRNQIDENKEKPLFSQKFKDIAPGTFLYELSKRETDVRNGRKSTIIFIRYKDANKKEYSAYIDYRERLKNDNFEEIFNGSKDLIPRPSDLSYYNWNQKKVYSNDSTFFRVDAAPKERLSFRNNTDRKTINVDLHYLATNNNTDVIRQTYDIDKNIDNVSISKILEDISERVYKNKCDSKKHEIKPKGDILTTKINIDRKEIGYQQIVIFDYQTRNQNING